MTKFYENILQLDIYHFDGNASKPHIMIFDGNIFLIPFSKKCQWLVPKFEGKVYQNSKKIEVATIQSPVCFETVFCVS